VHFFDWSEVVEDPDGAAVRGENEIVVGSLKLNVVHRNSGKIIFEGGPVSAAVPRNPEAEFGPGEKKIAVARMFANDVDGAGGVGNAGADGLPSFAVVGGSEDIDAVVVGAMTVEGDESSAFRGFGGNNAGDVGAFGKAGNFAGDVGPGFAAIARDLDVAVVSTRPENVGSERRLADGGDGGIFLDAIVARESFLVGSFAEDLQFVAVDARGQIVAEASPGVALIGGFEEIV